jgi:hypothetical protein
MSADLFPINQTQTEIYRLTEREARLPKCRSACTLAMSLPNVCVYKDSTLKFHLAYDPRDHAVNPQVSQQMFESYPEAIRARLGSLARDLVESGRRQPHSPAVRKRSRPRPHSRNERREKTIRPQA